MTISSSRTGSAWPATGLSAYLRDNNPQSGSGSGGLVFTSGSSGNSVQDNVFLGLSGVAVAVRGTSQTIRDNFIGTRSDGQVSAKQTDPHSSARQWTGWGAAVSALPTPITSSRTTFSPEFALRSLSGPCRLTASGVSGQRHTI